ncbi:MAG: DNA internalization-related competence protein ComEC/Rec2 [Chloroflexi bacterium]|nr:DNA internalization-related competence protein ComEC/Rec2 [Chloroflexota bacterium]
MSPGSSAVARRLQGLRLPYQPPLLHWSLAFTVGAALSLTGANIWAVALAAAVVCAFAFSSGARIDAVTTRQRLHLTLILLSPVLLGAGYWRANDTRLPADSLAAADLAGQTVRLTGVVAEEPQFRSTGVRLLLDAQTIAIGSEGRSVRDRVRLHIPDPQPIEFGDRIAIDAVLTPTSISEDEYLQWLANQRIAASGLVRAGSLRQLGQADIGWRHSLAADAREALDVSLRNSLPPPLSGIAQGIVTGRSDAIDPELRSELNDTSLSHLIVISGSNLTLLITMVMAASAWLVGRRGAALLAILAALSYGTLIGPDPPVQRAMWMAVVFASSHLLGRGSSALYAVGATAVLMVALEPPVLLDLSFQLTLAGTLGIVILMPTISQEFLSGQRGLSGAVRDAALVTLVATLTTMPLIALHFERASLIGLAANLAVTPLFSWIMLGSAFTAVVGLVSDGLAAIIAWPLSWLPLRWLVFVAEEVAQLPGAGTTVQGFGHVHLLLIYAAILVASLRTHRERVARWTRTSDSRDVAKATALLGRIGLEAIPELRGCLRQVVVCGIASAVAATLWLSATSEHADRLHVHFLDVGQGDSALLVTPAGGSVLIDTGERSHDTLAALRSHLPTNSRRIDLVVITHPQSDHGEALWAVLEHYDVGQVLLSAYVERTAFGRRLVDLLEQHDTPRIEAEPGRQIELAGASALTLDVLWPPARGLPEEYRDNPNSTSIVIRARYGDAAFLFTGDINVEQELDLVRHPCANGSQPCELRADVLKVAHQGSRFSSSTLFLETVRPTLAILSAGADNPHGHPHDEVLTSLAAVGATSLLTAEHGDISLATDGTSISVTTER